MIIYRIYKVYTDFEWSPYTDDCIYTDKDETIKYVDSKEKVDVFFKKIEDKNDIAMKCVKCPIISLTKRQYTNGKHSEVNEYCNECDLKFNGNRINCNNYKFTDLTDYKYEEIEVE